MPSHLDNTLASNVATGLLLPRLDQAIGHGVKYLLQQITATAADALARLERRSPAADLSPRAIQQPGNAAPMTAASGNPISLRRMETLTCSETGRTHPVLPRDQCEKMTSYMKAINTAAFPRSYRFEEGQGDAFTTKVQTTEGELDLLPPSLTTSTLLNRNLRIKGADADVPAVSYKGQVQNEHPNTLFDPLTGFAASISVRDDREVVVNFSGMGSQGAGFRQFLRCAANILGLTPPKNFAQASQLTQIVQARLNELNQKLPPGEQPYSLKLAGHSMGGGMATYAALRNNVKAVVFNPLRLGLLARAKVGRPALKNAPNLVTEVVVKTDWVADNPKSRLYGLLHVPSIMLTGRRADAWGAIGTRYLVPKPSKEAVAGFFLSAGYWRNLEGAEREATIEEKSQSYDVHSWPELAIEIHGETLDPYAPPPPPRTGRLLG